VSSDPPNLLVVKGLELGAMPDRYTSVSGYLTMSGRVRSGLVLALRRSQPRDKLVLVASHLTWSPIT